MPRKATLEFFVWSFKMLLAWLKCCFYILKYKPDVIFGTGGYVSAPVLCAGMTMKVPFVMHDCDANPGLVTRKFAPFAKSISVAFDVECEKLHNKNCVVNGNPIRKEFSTLTKEQARENLGLENKLTICVMGGSQGAKKINEAATGILKELSARNIQVIFQTGKRNYDDVIRVLNNTYPEYASDKNVIVRPYFDNMVEVLKASDIAVSRAGSLSISELCASGIASVFVPYPYAAADHQRKNAKYMLNNGAGLYIDDSATNAETLLKKIEMLTNDAEFLKSVQQKALSLAKYDGVDGIVKQIKDC
jgi:UDP-N-acetylglucosamine--N-acetylmuramyl-(pentapeptide) pyrophosphoryl-undecaprenol N-acetylglucosamine transferase